MFLPLSSINKRRVSCALPTKDNESVKLNLSTAAALLWRHYYVWRNRKYDTSENHFAKIESMVLEDLADGVERCANKKWRALILPFASPILCQIFRVGERHAKICRATFSGEGSVSNVPSSCNYVRGETSRPSGAHGRSRSGPSTQTGLTAPQLDAHDHGNSKNSMKISAVLRPVLMA